MKILSVYFTGINKDIYKMVQKLRFV